MRNPFEFGRELSPEELVDRTEEVTKVANTMLAGGKLFLIGPRRYGKTSILLAASQEATLRKAIVLRYNAEAFPSLEQLAARLLADTVTRLTSNVEKAGTALKDLFATVRPLGSFDPSDGKWTVTIGATGPRATGVPLLADVLDGVERAAEKADRPVAVVLDEFQKVVEEGGTAAEGQIRAAIQQHRHVGYVFAGSKARLLADMTSDPNRPFYKLGTVRFLGAIPREDFAAFLEQNFQKGGIVVMPGTTEAILDAAEDVPYNVQALAHACWEACRNAGDVTPMSLTPAFVREIRDTVALRNDPLYTQIWTSLPASQQKALLAVLRERGGRDGLASTEVSRRYNLPVTTMSKALKGLEAKGILREEQAHGTVRLRLEDPFFGTWVELLVPR